jgi:hypothetical protein
MQDLGKVIVGAGLLLVLIGLIVWKVPGAFGWLGKLPGDMSVQKGNFSFYFPLATCVLISVILTLVSWLLRR